MNKKIIFVIISLFFFSGYMYLFQPHITLKEVRISSTPTEIKAVYVNITGDPLCAKLYRTERMEDNNATESQDPLFLALPNGMPSPDDGKWSYSDNLFLLKGYQYQFETQNKLTGDSKISPSYRFDVIAWEVIAPYKQWEDTPQDGDDTIDYTTATTPVRNEFESGDHDQKYFLKSNYVDCAQ